MSASAQTPASGESPAITPDPEVVARACMVNLPFTKHEILLTFLSRQILVDFDKRSSL